MKPIYKMNRRGKMIPAKPISAVEFWKQKFGQEYLKRNRVDWEARIPFFRRMVELTNAQSFLEVGCNAGWNLRALREIDKDFTMTGCDVNREALEEAQGHRLDVVECAGKDVLNEEGLGPDCCQMAFTCGVLIHIEPADLLETMQTIAKASSQFVLAVEYDAPEETEVEYRGHAGKLWKRPFGKLYGELGLSLIETGKAEGFDDCTYWLFSK